MAKRIIVVKDNNKIEIWDYELETFEKKGFSKEGSSPIIKQTKTKLTIKYANGNIRFQYKHKHLSSSG